MGARAHIVVRTLSVLEGKPEAEVPGAALRDYFAALDVDLSFSHGEPLARDPTNEPDLAEEFVAQNSPPAGTGGPAILVVADLGYGGSRVNGMLLDVRRRGACSVFTESTGFRDHAADGRFEIFAHEIGHLFDLRHEQAGETFATVMNQWGRRVGVGDRAGLWTEAMALEPADYGQRLRGFFGSGTRKPSPTDQA